MKKIYLLFMAVILFAKLSVAQTNISNYTFSATTGNAYTAITGGTAFVAAGVGYDNNISAAITMGGTFPFGGANMTTCYISANGYITFGAAPSGTNYTPLATLGTTTGAISAFGQDAGSSTATGAVPEIRYQNLGTEFVVQYTDHANYYNRTTERLNFQIRLTYATGAINIIYGSCTNPGTVSTSGTTPQVGIRGNSVTWGTNINNLLIGNVPAATTCDWSTAVTGNANSSNSLFSGTTNVNVKIPSGLMYTWTPGTLLPVTTFAAVSGITSTDATLSWTAPAGATQYNIRYRIPGTCTWTNYSGNPVASTTATLTGLTANTSYQIQVQASNGSANSIWSHIPTSAAGAGLNGYTATGTFTTLPLACSGTPSGGTVTQPLYNICPGSTATLTVTGQTNGVTGLTYQWEQSADGVTGWTPATGGTGATTLSYTTPAYVSGSLYYRLTITCTTSSLSGSSTVTQVTSPAVPATQATAFTATSLTAAGATLNWVVGSGNNRSVYINTTNTFTDPTTPSSPGTAATVFTNTGQQLVYDGTGTSVSVTGLTAGTTYYVRIYESQKCTAPAAWYFNVAAAAGNPGSFTTLVPPSNDLVCNAINLVVDDPSPVCVNTTAATVTATDPDITSCSTPNNTVWYKFTPTTSGFHTITASVPAASTKGMSAWLFTYTATGTCPGTLTFTAAGGLSCTAGPSSAAAGTTTSVTTSSLTAGTTYYIYVDGNTGDFGDICLRVSSPAPMSYVSSTTTQPVVTSVSQGSTGNQIVALNVVVSGSASPLTVTNINFNTNGTTLPADITQAKVYFTGTSSTFAATTQFGTAYLNPNGTFSVVGSQALTGAATGNTTNYFWLAYDVACSATIANVLDGEVTSFDMGSNYVPTVTAPAGTRAITALYSPTRTDGNSTTAISLGSVNAQMVYGVISGSSACAANVTKVDFTVSGTNPAADINFAKCYYTTTSTFSNAIPFGAPVANPAAGTVSFTGTQALATGSNYFWMVYDINCSGTVANTVNGDINTIYVNSSPISVTGTATAANALAAASATYTTVADGDWSNAATWSCGNIPPSATTAVAINNNITVTTTGNIAGDVTIASGKTLTLSPGGDLTMGTSSAGAASGNSNKTLTSNGILTIDGGTLNVNGGIVLNATSVFNISRGILNLDPNDGTSATSYSSSNGAFYILTSNLNATGGAINILDPMYTASAGTGQSVISYSVTTTDAALGTSCAVTFGGGDDQNALNVNGFYVECNVSTGTLEIGNGIAAGGRFAAQREVTTRQSATNYITKFRNLTVNTGAEVVMTAGSAPLGITGNIVNNGVITNAGASTASGFIFGDVQYSGGVVISPLTTAQSISGTGVFKKSTADADPTAQTGNIIGSMSVYHLVSSPGLTLNMPMTVTNNLRLLKGKVNTTPTNILALGNGTAIPGNPTTLTSTTGTLDGLTFSVTTASAYDGGHVVGPFNRWVTAATTSGQQGLMPVGSDTSRVAQILFTTAPTTGGYLTASWTDGSGTSPVSPTLNQAGVTPSTITMSTNAKWNIVNAGTLTGGTYTASMNNKRATAVLSYANTVLLKRATAATGSAWEDDGAGGPIGVHVASTGSNTSVTAGRSGLTTFSSFAIGGGAAVLPISLEYFTGRKQAAVNILDWKVSSSSASTLTLERSTDRVNYKTINVQTASIDRMLTPFTYTDAAPAAGVNYYRLKITNADGESKYSNVVALINKDKGFELISMAPNPVQHSTVLSLSSVKAGKIELSVSDITGKVVMKQSVSVIAGNNPITLNFATLAAGTYQITAINADGDSKSTRFVKF